MKARRINEHDWDEERYEGENGPFINDDGWDEEALEEVGLIDWMENVQRIQYEILNARRGSYGISGTTAEYLVGDLEELKRSLEAIIENIQDEL